MTATTREVDASGLRTAGLEQLERRLRRGAGKAISDFGMIENGDRVMVCLSGGADSYTLLDILLGLQKAAPIDFELLAVNLDQKQPGFPSRVLPDYLESQGVDYRIVEEDTYSVVKRVIPEGRTTCSLCSRLRRGVLYRTAAELGADKIALGHHADDIVETAFLNMFFNSRLKAMPAKLKSDDGRHVVIRPLAYLREALIKQYAGLRNFPIIPCDLCGSQPNLQRQSIKAMLRQWDDAHPGRVDNILRSLCSVTPSHLLDRELFDFRDL
jgi:tRNA 2-thiocytidine biosynthesis protein TtcA